MRIISGSWRGHPLKIPPKTRPTTDRVKEAIFSILPEARNLRVLDLYAGSGALGLEALSRGAGSACFVDISRPALNVIKENLRGKETARIVLVRQDVRDFLRTADRPFDWIFCDPPYQQVNYVELLKGLAESAALGSDTLLVLESDRYHAFEIPASLRLRDSRKFGDTLIFFIKRDTQASPDRKQRA